jgi:hypothetical protein
MREFDDYFAGRIPDHTEIIDKPLTELQQRGHTKIPYDASRVYNFITTIREHYSLGNLGRTVAIFQKRISEYEHMRVWSAERAQVILPSMKSLVTKRAHQEELETIVKELGEALERVE